MERLYITHYYFKDTDPWKNIMNLPEEDAFKKAAELAGIEVIAEEVDPGPVRQGVILPKGIDHRPQILKIGRIDRPHIPAENKGFARHKIRHKDHGAYHKYRTEKPERG